MKNLHMATFILTIAGALNWGLIGMFNYNLIYVLFGNFGMLDKLVYLVIGMAGVYEIVIHKQNCKTCSA